MSQARVLWALWITYGAFYFCRTNLAAALPGLEVEFGYSKTQLGLLLGSLKLSYGIGQLINGQLAERARPRLLLALGMFGSAALNVFFGLSTGLFFMLFIWASNGYFQALGWTPCMRVAANWFSVKQRGRAVGIIGTGYQVTAVLTFLVSGWAVQTFGWRGAVYFPALILALLGIHMLLFLQEHPPSGSRFRDTRGPDMEGVEGLRSRSRISLMATLSVTLSNPLLWLLAVSLGLLNACRYGFLDWGISHLSEVQESGVGMAAFKYAVLPAGGVLGAYLSGWFSDRVLGGRRSPVICSLLLLLTFLTVAYNWSVNQGVTLTVFVLLAVGFAIYGAQVLLVGTAPMDLAREDTSAAAVGFVNFVGYLGAFWGDQLTGHLVDSHGWRTAVMGWAGFALAAAVVSALLWVTNDRRQESGAQI